MKQTGDTQRLLLKYLLHELLEEEQSRIEERYFVDLEFHQQLRAAERDLIDRYVRGELIGEEKERFEKYFLSSPRRQERVEFARALAESIPPREGVISERQPDRGAASWWQPWLASLRGVNWGMALSAAILLVAFGLGLTFALMDRRDPEQEVVQQQEGSPAEHDEHPKGSPPQPETERAQPKEADKTPHLKPTSRVATFTLTPDLTRDAAETKEIIIAPGINTIRLRLHLDGVHGNSYRAVLITPEGKKIWGEGRLKGKPTKLGDLVVVRLPAGLLTSRDYVLRLSGTAEGDDEDVSRYYFRVNKQ